MQIYSNRVDGDKGLFVYGGFLASTPSGRLRLCQEAGNLRSFVVRVVTHDVLIGL